MEALATDLIFFAEGAFKGSLKNPYKFPDQLSYLWEFFGNLNLSRTGNGFGPNPILYSEILALSQLYRVRLEEWELSVIRRLDSLFMQEMMNKNDNQPKVMNDQEFADRLRAMSKDKGMGR